LLAVSVGCGSIDCSNVEDLPQFKHSAAVLPSAPFSNRYSLPPQCGHMNFMGRSPILSQFRCDALNAVWELPGGR
jgi:hypothetical protein